MTASDPMTSAACEWCGRAVAQNAEGRWYAVKGAERGYDPLTCEASDDCRHDAPDVTEPHHVNLAGRWRVGRKVGRTIYAQQGPEPSDDDPLIGVMDYPGLAALAVRCRNGMLIERPAHNDAPSGPSTGR